MTMLKRTVPLTLLGLSIQLAGWASQTDMIAAFDSALEKRAAHSAAAALFTAAAEHQQNVTVRIIDGIPAPDWTSSKPLSLADFTTSPLRDVFRGSSTTQISEERKHRVDSALREFDEYFAPQIGTGGPCLRLARTAQQLIAEDRQLGVLFFGRPICSSPRITVTLPLRSHLIVVNLLNETAAEDCVRIAEERRIVASFPQAYVTPTLDANMLGMVLTTGTFPNNHARVTVRGCSTSPSEVIAYVDTSKRDATYTATATTDKSATVLVGKTGASATWFSGWIDLPNPTTFSKAEKLRIKVGGTAAKVVVCLRQKGSDVDSSAGVIPVIIPVRADLDRIIEVQIPDDTSQVIQISVHGGPNPWNEFPLGSGNGPATLIAAERIR